MNKSTAKEEKMKQMADMKDEMEQSAEDYIIRSIGNGYLKPPQEVRDILKKDYGKKLSQLPSPDVFFSDNEDTIRILYEIDKQEVKNYKTEDE